MLPNIRKLVIEVEYDHTLSPYSHRHQTDPFQKRFNALKISILKSLKQYVPIDVIPKIIPNHYRRVTQSLEHNLYMDTKHNKLVHFPRKNSFEISVDSFVIFSRLKSGEWPSISLMTDWAIKVAQKIIDMAISNEEEPVKEFMQQQNETKDCYYKYFPPLPSTPIKDIELQSQSAIRYQKLPQIDRLGDRIEPNSVFSYYDVLPVTDLKKKRYLNNQRASSDRGRNQIQRNSFTPNLTFYKPNAGEQMLTARRRQLQNQFTTINTNNLRTNLDKQTFTWHFGDIKNNGLKRAQNNKKRQSNSRNRNIELKPLQLPSTVQPIQPQFLQLQQKTERAVKKIQLKLSESIVNCHRSSYIIHEQQITRSTAQGNWCPLLNQAPLPLHGRHYFSVAILISKSNKIQIGIAPISYYPKIGKPTDDDTLIQFNLNNGMIKDSKLDGNKMKTSWRMGGEAAPKDKSYQLRVVVDIDHSFIDWYVEEQLVGSAQLTKVYGQGCRMFVNLQQKGDVVLLNDQDWVNKPFEVVEVGSKHEIDKQRQGIMNNPQKSPEREKKQEIIQQNIKIDAVDIIDKQPRQGKEAECQTAQITNIKMINQQVQWHSQDEFNTTQTNPSPQINLITHEVHQGNVVHQANEIDIIPTYDKQVGQVYKSLIQIKQMKIKQNYEEMRIDTKDKQSQNQLIEKSEYKTLSIQQPKLEQANQQTQVNAKQQSQIQSNQQNLFKNEPEKTTINNTESIINKQIVITQSQSIIVEEKTGMPQQNNTIIKPKGKIRRQLVVKQPPIDKQQKKWNHNTPISTMQLQPTQTPSPITIQTRPQTIYDYEWSAHYQDLLFKLQPLT